MLILTAALAAYCVFAWLVVGALCLNGFFSREDRLRTFLTAPLSLIMMIYELATIDPWRR